MDLNQKFQKVAASLKSQFVERAEVVDGLMCAALAGEHVLLLGAPGAAKSALISAFTNAVKGASHFEWLLGKFSTPEELFGPVSLKALKAEEYRRVTTGKLPEADVAFLDEVFKANSAILNTLLPVMNERKFYNNGKPVKIPLRMMVGASNELPDGAELAALYDRFLVRFWVQYVNDADNWVKMVTGGTIGNGATLTLEEWDVARAEVAEVKVDAAIGQELYKLKQQLAKDSIIASDRRWRSCIRLLQAAAWLSGETEVMEDHFSVLSAVLWTEQGEIEKTKAHVEAAAGATASESAKIVDTIRSVMAGMPSPEKGTKLDNQQQQRLIEGNREGARATAALKELAIKARTTRAKEKAAAALKEVEGMLNPLRQVMREQLGL